jgi:hypothetical protein
MASTLSRNAVIELDPMFVRPASNIGELGATDNLTPKCSGYSAR